MKTSAFLAALRTHSSLPLVFRFDNHILSPGYHLTEVKRVTYETMDCGAMPHRWSESQFELWAPARDDVDPSRGHMVADKFVRIVNRVEAELPLGGDDVARIFASFDGQPASLFEIETVRDRAGELRVELAPDRARCKASERQLSATGSACCGTDAPSSEPRETAVACGCTSAQPVAAGAACCV